MINDLSTDWLKIIWSAISGIFMTILGYFIPIKDIFLLLVLFFAMDAVFGFLAARKLYKEAFSQRKIWNTTVPRLGGSLVLIMLAFMWDDVYKQNAMHSYIVIGWFLSGILLAKIAFNLYHITNWDVFLGLGKYFTSRSSQNSDIQLTHTSENEPHTAN